MIVGSIQDILLFPRQNHQLIDCQTILEKTHMTVKALNILSQGKPTADQAS